MSTQSSIGEKAPPAISVVVLSYNSAKFIPECLDRIAASRGVTIQLICIDNKSSDDSLAVMEQHARPNVVISAEKNLGYSGGNNAAVRHATASILVFLNPDCWVEPDTLAKLTQPLRDDPSIAVTGGLLKYPTGEIQHAGAVLFPNATTAHLGKDAPPDTVFENRDVDYVTGAMLAIRWADFQALGGFDEDYFPAYYEEADLCFRLKQANLRIQFVADAIATHHETPHLLVHSERFDRMVSQARMRFAVKNFGIRYGLRSFLPYERRWLRSINLPTLKKAVRQSYYFGIKFAFRCLLRGSRRPKATAVYPVRIIKENSDRQAI